MSDDQLYHVDGDLVPAAAATVSVEDRGFAYGDGAFETMRAYVEDGTIAYDAYLRDETAEVAHAYGAVCTPDPFLFRHEGGTYRLAYHGRLDDAMTPDEAATECYIRQAIDAVHAGEPVGIDPGPSRGCGIKWP